MLRWVPILWNFQTQFLVRAFECVADRYPITYLYGLHSFFFPSMPFIRFHHILAVVPKVLKKPACS